MEFDDIFEKYDTNHDGFLTRDEFLTMLKDVGQDEPEQLVLIVNVLFLNIIVDY